MEKDKMDSIMDKWDLERAKEAEKRRRMNEKSNKILAVFFVCEFSAIVLFLLWVLH